MAVSSSLVSLLSLVGIYAILAIGLNIKFGYTGLLEIGHVVFYLIGAYTAALLVSPPASTVEFAVYSLGWNWPWIPAVAAGMIVAGIAGVLVSLPAIRLREDYLAIVTLGVSIIAMRILQTEQWIANGPDSLSTFTLPLRSLMPLPQPTPGSAVLFGAVVGVVFTGFTFAMTEWVDFSPHSRVRRALVHGGLALSSLGLPYVAIRIGGRRSLPRAWVMGGVGLAMGVAGALASLAGAGVLGLFVFLGAASVCSWVLAAVVTVQYMAGFSRRTVTFSLGLAAGTVIALAPGVVVPSVLGGLLSVGLFGALLYAGVRLSTTWDATRENASFLQLLAATGIWLFVLRYFVLSVVGPLTAGNLGAVLVDAAQNILWLLQFARAGIQFDYSRLLLVGILLILAGVYVVTEWIVNAPYGRVLKAIREDEQVAEALGKPVFTYKVQSMAIGSAIAGLAGGLTAIYFRSLTYNMFHPRVTFFVLLVVIIGGTANNKGMILGALIYWGFQKGTGDIAALFPSGDMRTRIQAVRLALFGLVFVVLLYYRPDGLLSRRTTATEGDDA